MSKSTMSFYISDRQKEWLKEMSRINHKPMSYFVKLGLEKLIEMTGGYEGDEF